MRVGVPRGPFSVAPHTISRQNWTGALAVARGSGLVIDRNVLAFGVRES